MRIILKNLLTTLRRYPTAVLLNVAGLSVAFAAFLLILMQVRYEYSFNSHIPQADHVFRVSEYLMDKQCAIFDQPLVEELNASSVHIQAGVFIGVDYNLSGDFSVERPNGRRDYFHAEVMDASPSLAEVLGLEIVEGDASALEGEDRVLIPLSLARKLFPEESAVGKLLLLTSPNYTRGAGLRETPRTALAVGGVYRDFPANSTFKNVIFEGHPWRDTPGNVNYHYYVRLDDPAYRQEVLGAMTETFRRAESGELPAGTQEPIRLTPVREVYFETDVAYENILSSATVEKGSRRSTGVLLAIALLVIGIAAINFVNFASALAPVRMKMVNLQKILGASAGQLRVSLLVESVAIALTAYLAAVWIVAAVAATPFVRYVRADLSFAANGPLLGGCLIVAVGVGLAAGLYPAVYMTSFRPILAIRGSFGGSAAGRRYRIGLVCLQYVISLVLIVSTLFVNLQNGYMTRIEPGYDKDQVLAVQLPEDAWEKRKLLAERLRACAGLEDAAFAHHSFAGKDSGYQAWSAGYETGTSDAIVFQLLIVSPDFLRVLGIPVAEGRDFLPSDELREPHTYIFNEAARRQFGLRLGSYVGPTNRGEIVGFLAENLQIFSQHKTEEPFAFLVFGTNGWENESGYCYVRIKAGTDLRDAVDLVRRTVGEITPFETEIRFQDTVVNSLYENELKTGVLVTSFSVLAILISLTGVFGLVLFETQYRRKEIGIRKVNGATSAEILWMFNRRFAAIVGVSFVVAAPAAWYGVSLWMRNFRSAVPLSAWVFAAALAAVLLITVVTVTVRSWHTAGENPIKSVKTE